MTKDEHNDGDSDVQQALQNAAAELQAAVVDASKGTSSDVASSIAASEAAAHEGEPQASMKVDYEEDLAAAFFAQQARKKEYEKTLPTKEWASILVDPSPPNCDFKAHTESTLPTQKQCAQNFMESFRQATSAELI